jgi:hypothetical protein
MLRVQKISLDPEGRSGDLHIDPIDILQHALEVEPPQVPVRGGRGKRDSEFSARGVERRSQLLEQLYVVLGIVVFATTIWRTGIFPVNINT